MRPDPLDPWWREKVETAAREVPIWSTITADILAEAREYMAAGLPLKKAAQLCGVMAADLDIALWRSFARDR